MTFIEKSWIWIIDFKLLTAITLITKQFFNFLAYYVHVYLNKVHIYLSKVKE